MKSSPCIGVFGKCSPNSKYSCGAQGVAHSRADEQTFLAVRVASNSWWERPGWCGSSGSCVGAFCCPKYCGKFFEVSIEKLRSIPFFPVFASFLAFLIAFLLASLVAFVLALLFAFLLADTVDDAELV